MSKKDFIELADHIKTHNKFTVRCEDPDPFTPEQLDVLAAFCRAQNPRFNRERWLSYIAGECGPNGGKVK